MEWIILLSALASAISAVLAWAAKLWWSKEHIAAKDEIIKAKDAQIDLLNAEIKNLQELTPMKIREYFLSVRTQLEEYNEKLQTELSQARDELMRRDEELLQEYNLNRKAELLTRRKELMQRYKSLNTRLWKVSKLKVSVEASSDLPFIPGESIKGLLRYSLEDDLKKEDDDFELQSWDEEDSNDDKDA